MKLQRHLGMWALDENHLSGRMSFIAGPRQVGKTTLVQDFLEKSGFNQNYHDWDTVTVRRRFATHPTFFAESLEPMPQGGPKRWVAFDEIHKYPKWKNLLKGFHDEFKKQIQFVVTGSARLDLFRRSGDSLVGRYFLFKMFPLGPREVLSATLNISQTWRPDLPLEQMPPNNQSYFDAIQNLLAYSGFPEPFLRGSQAFSNLWRENHISLIVGEDLRDLTKISELKKLETLVFLLPERIGSPLSLNQLRGTLETAHNTVKLWLEALTKVCILFSLPPYTNKLSRSVVKEQKFYFWDWGLAGHPGSVFENFVAVNLSRAVSFWNELGYGPFQLYYVRTKDGLEVDFLVADRKKAHFLIECKHSEDTLSPTLVKIKEKLGVSLVFQVINKQGYLKREGEGVYVIGIDRLMQILP